MKTRKTFHTLQLKQNSHSLYFPVSLPVQFLWQEKKCVHTNEFLLNITIFFQLYLSLPYLFPPIHVSFHTYPFHNFFTSPFSYFHAHLFFSFPCLPSLSCSLLFSNQLSQSVLPSHAGTCNCPCLLAPWHSILLPSFPISPLHCIALALFYMSPPWGKPCSKIPTNL